MDAVSELVEEESGMTEDHHRLIREMLEVQRSYQQETRGISATPNAMAVSISRLDVQVQTLLAQQAAFPGFAERLQRLETRLDEAEKRQVATRWLIGLVTALFVSLLALTIAHVA